MEQHNDTYHVTPFRVYIIVFTTLLIMTLLTVLVSVRVTGISLGAMGPLVAFSIATFKAFLVITYFMHMKYDSLLNRVVLASGFFLLLLLYAILAIDIATRVPVESAL